MNWLPQVVAALVAIESGAPGGNDGGAAHGCLQIHADVIRDVNRFYRTSFTLEDTREIKHARLICQLYLQHWTRIARAKINRHNRAMSKAGLETNAITDAELAARIWNGGPDGWRKAATADYGQRVLNLIRDNSRSLAVQNPS